MQQLVLEQIPLVQARGTLTWMIYLLCRLPREIRTSYPVRKLARNIACMGVRRVRSSRYLGWVCTTQCSSFSLSADGSLCFGCVGADEYCQILNILDPELYRVGKHFGGDSWGRLMEVHVPGGVRANAATKWTLNCVQQLTYGYYLPSVISITLIPSSL
jgi:hypothetical protein